jgi:hypothetical protein
LNESDLKPGQKSNTANLSKPSRAHARSRVRHILRSGCLSNRAAMNAGQSRQQRAIELLDAALKVVRAHGLFT